MTQAFDKLSRPLQEVSRTARTCAPWPVLSQHVLVDMFLVDLQGATNQQLEHAIMVLLQTLEDLTRAQYKGNS